ncbi:MAG: helix-turn-helix domain-containing protein [Pseudomonadota bacterium]
MATTSHVDHVFAAVSNKQAAAINPIAASWRRSIVAHGLSPETTDANRARLTSREIGEVIGQRAAFVRVAQPRLEALYGAVGASGFCVALTDESGVILARRSSSADKDHFDRVGLRTGFEWSEAAQGTNGIGTCLYERRPVVVHRNEHFMSCYTGISCIDAPVFGAHGELIGALDVSGNRLDHSSDLNKVISLSVSQYAGQIEADVFADVFSGSRIVVAGSDPSSGQALLAVDESDIVIGATRAARARYDLGTTPTLAPIPLNDLLYGDGASGGFDRSEKMVIRRALVRANGNASEAAKALGISRATLYRRMNKLGLDRS